jgi:maleylacetoacetate isomerase
MTRILYGYWRSSAAYRVRIALGLKGLDYEQRSVNLRDGGQFDPAWRALNPQGVVPLLVEDGLEGLPGGGLAQSLAIIDYLDERYPDPPLTPGNAAERARLRALAMTVACDIHPINNLRVLKYLKHELALDQPRIDGWARHWVESGFAPLEAEAARSGGRYLGGDAVTVADICLVPQLYNARRVETQLAPFPRRLEIEARLGELAAFAAAVPERQPDAPQPETITTAERSQ